MAVFKCKMCGGDLEIAEGASVAECQYCGSKQTLPRFDSERKINLYDRANHFRRNNEFDKAEGIYENILNEDPTDAEAYWSLVLCRYGIEYVEDPATRRRIPTVNRAQYTSVFADENYKKAVEYADALQKSVYEDEAKAIDAIQKGILEISEKEDPFDVFICYKETDAQGRRTPDSVLANELYHELVSEGFKVFFSRITLEDKLGTAYEPYIFAALHSARVMVVLGTKPEYFNAVWVKNEWSRYLALIRSGEKKTLIPAYRDMDPYDLPEEFSHLQAQDMSKLGFMPDLIRGVKKLLEVGKPKEAEPVQPVVQQTVVQSAGGANLTAQIKRGMIALEDKDWTAADSFFDKALDMDAECAEAYFGKALAAAQCANGDTLAKKRSSDVPRSEEMLTACERDRQLIQNAKAKYAVTGYLTDKEIEDCFSYDARTFPSLTKAWNERIAAEKNYWEKDRQMSRAVRYAKGSFAETLRTTRAGIEETLQAGLSRSKDADTRNKEKVYKQYSAEMEKAQKAAETKYKAALERRKADYDSYCAEQANAKTADDYSKAENHFRFEGMRGYENSDQRAEQCRTAAEKLRAEAKAAAERAAKVKKEKTTRGIIIAAATLVVVVAGVLVTSKVIIPNASYRNALMLKNTRDYEAAIAAFEALDGYRDSAVQIEECKTAIKDVAFDKAIEYKDAADYETAIAAFETLDGYRDSAAQVEECKIAIKDVAFNEAIAYKDAGDYETAIAAFEALDGYRDSAAQVEECKTAIKDVAFDKAIAQKDSGDYETAIAAFEALDGYRDSAVQIEECKTAIKEEAYEKALALKTSGDYKAAVMAFESLDGFKDSAKQIDQLMPLYFKGLFNSSIGDYVLFGTYEQDNNTADGKEDVEWLVLAKNGDRMLLISKYALDCQKYDSSSSIHVTWETCSLRNWLNEDFLNTTFTEKEQMIIPSVTVSADKNPYYSSNPGNSTTDRVFLLSITEANAYFKSNIERQCQGTAYSYKKADIYKDNNGCLWWWLRSPGNDYYVSSYAAGVDYDGSVDDYGHATNMFVGGAIRPALWVDIG